MAKKKDDVRQSVLKLAYEAFERGDAIQARALANQVLAGKVGKDDEAYAPELATKLSNEEQVVQPTVEAVAKDLASRTIVQPKPYIMVAVVAAAFLLLAVLAAVRY